MKVDIFSISLIFNKSRDSVKSPGSIFVLDYFI